MNAERNEGGAGTSRPTAESAGRRDAERGRSLRSGSASPGGAEPRSAAAEWPGPEVVAAVGARAGGESTIGLVLGSGLGGIADELAERRTFAADSIPGYPSSTVAGHEGKLHFGTWGGRPLWCVQGRVHLYEGHEVEVVTRYVRLLHALGVRTLILTNAAGSLTTTVQPGDIVLDRDAISLFFRPLARRHSAAEVWRRQAPLVAPELADLARAAGLRVGVPFHEGVLVGGLGPSYETAAEVRAWRRLGGTVASMSTVPEAVEARELGMRLLIFSLVTNLGTGLATTPLSHAEVVEVADRAGARLGRLLAEVVHRL